MYARRLRCRSHTWSSLFRSSGHLSRPSRRDIASDVSAIRKFRQPPARFQPTYFSPRFFSAEGDGRNASEGKHVPVNVFDKGKPREEAVVYSDHCTEHARLGELDQQEWLRNEKLSMESRRRAPPFLTRRQKFKKEFLRRVVPWEKITVSWDKFPYYIDENAKNLLVECAAAHLKHKDCAAKYGARLSSSGRRILLRTIPGTELYRERFVKALARELRVPLLVLDSSVLAPYDYGEDCSESESEDDNPESGGECTSELEGGDENNTGNEEWSSSNEKSAESEDDDSDDKESQKVIKNCDEVLEGFARSVSGIESTSEPAQADGAEPSEQCKRPLRKGVRVKYIGDPIEVNNRILLGKIPTSDGSTNAYTYISGRPLLNGQRGEVHEINGDQVALLLDDEDGNTDEASMEPDGKPTVHWVDSQDIVHDMDTQAEEWYMAMEAFREVLPSLHPIIVYFPDASQWLSRAVPKSSRKEFISKLEEIFDHLPGPVVLICGQNIQEKRPKEKDKYTMVLPHLGRIAKLPFPLKQLTQGLGPYKSPKEDGPNGIVKLFTNTLSVHPPKEEELLRTFSKQMEEDRRIIISRNNLVELHKVLEEHELLCMELLHLKTEGVILTKQKAEEIVGWARNHYLSSVPLPFIKGDRLVIPHESLDIAVSRLKGHETILKKPSQNLKALAKDEYESNFISAVVPPGEIGVKFDDIGALEDVKRTLNELVTLPMRRPELFSHGNLLRPCKGVLLFGPPGTGKTLLAKALATEAGANFISITGSTLTSKWFGDAEKLTKALFSFASKLAPVIIFVDEVDSLLGARGGAFEHEATRRMRNEFMAAWDGLRSKDSQRILILGATNRPFDLDDAVIRRLPRRIYVDLPDADNRLKILKILLSQENLDPGFRYDELANATEGYSGSDLKNLCVAAAYRPVQELLEQEKRGEESTAPLLRPLTSDDFIQAKAKVGASVAHDATSMNELRKWNEQYGEGGSRKHSPFGFGN